MGENKTYAGLDWFRIAAALLVAAIHTSPLMSYSEGADFILTRVIARTAVPFFFMLSGFFVISRRGGGEGLKSFLKRTAVIYIIAVCAYLPLNLYMGYFSMENLLPNLIKDLVFDGTMYHLWYLPAAIAGAAIAWILIEKTGVRYALLISAGLYLAGMLGDSYYGIAEQVPFLHGFYDRIFEVTDYTRNGIFFAPVFFVLGAAVSERIPERILPLKYCLAGLGISAAVMVGEGMTLHHFDLQRHDSMYIALLPCMYFLFCALTYWRGRRRRLLRDASLLIYLVHPMVIVGVRFAGKLLGMEELLIENSLMHYLAVCLISSGIAFSAAWIYEGQRNGQRKRGMKRPMKSQMKRQKKQKKVSPPDTDRTWIELDMGCLEHNLRELQGHMQQGCKMMAVVKANAYGHSALMTAQFLNRKGVENFAVATLDEGIELRKHKITGEILILGYTDPQRACELRKYDLSQSVVDYQHAVMLNRQNCRIKVHIKVDTGMHRLGFSAQAAAQIGKVWEMKNLTVCGIFSHLCAADSREAEDIRFTEQQIELFYRVLGELEGMGIKLPKIHIQSSYGFLNYPHLKCDYARIGIALYGSLSAPKDQTKLKLDLRPVMSLKSRVVLIRRIKKGETVGYGRTFTARRDSVIAVLPVGYADGYPRSLSCGNGSVILKGRYAPVIGRVCMDQLTIDVTDVPGVRVGDTATLIGEEKGAVLPAAEIAERTGSITNELFSRLAPRSRVSQRHQEIE